LSIIENRDHDHAPFWETNPKFRVQAEKKTLNEYLQGGWRRSSGLGVEEAPGPRRNRSVTSAHDAGQKLLMPWVRVTGGGYWYCKGELRDVIISGAGVKKKDRETL